MRNEATASAVLPKLATLQTQLHNVSRDKRSQSWPVASFDAIHELLSLPMLRHIETRHDVGHQSFFDFQGSRYEHNEIRPRFNLLQWLPKIGSMSLSSANYHCGYFYAACEMATNFRRLELDTVGIDSGHSSSHFHSDATLDSALLPRAEMLEELRLAGFERHAFKQLSASHRLTRFPSIAKLRILTLDVFLLFGPWEQIDRLSLPDLLPPNLELLDPCDARTGAYADFGDFLFIQPQRYLDVLVRQPSEPAAAVQERRKDQKGWLSRLRGMRLWAGSRCVRYWWLQVWQLRQVEEALDHSGVLFTHVLPPPDKTE